MGGTKVTTVIVNQTEQGMTLKVGNRNCYAKLTSVKVGGEYRMQLDINWTYQEFVLEDKRDAGRKLFINSDDCCDYERITITEAGGQIVEQRVPRKRFGADSDDMIATEVTDSDTKPKEKHSWISRLWY